MPEVGREGLGCEYVAVYDAPAPPVGLPLDASREVYDSGIAKRCEVTLGGNNFSKTGRELTGVAEHHREHGRELPRLEAVRMRLPDPIRGRGDAREVAVDVSRPGTVRRPDSPDGLLLEGRARPGLRNHVLTAHAHGRRGRGHDLHPEEGMAAASAVMSGLTSRHSRSAGSHGVVPVDIGVAPVADVVAVASPHGVHVHAASVVHREPTYVFGLYLDGTWTLDAFDADVTFL